MGSNTEAFHGETGGTVHSQLLTLEDVGTTRSWDYESATLVQRYRYTSRSPMMNETFRKVFYQHYPALEEMRWDNVCVRGGAVVDFLLGHDPNDLDFFFYGLSDESQVLERAGEFLRFLLHTERKHVERLNNERAQKKKEQPSSHSTTAAVAKIDIKSVRRGSVITVKTSAISVPIQIVLGMNASKQTLSNASDMAVSGCLFDGRDVWLTAEAKWELENMSVVARPGRYPAKDRLLKYYGKGFDLIFPELDVGKLPKSYLPLGLKDAIQTPTFGFSYSRIDGNKIELDAFLEGSQPLTAVQDGSGCPTAPRASGGYLSNGGSDGELNSRDILYRNIAVLARLCKGGRVSHSTNVKSLFSVYAEADFVCDVLKPWPHLTARQVSNTYAGILEQIFSGKQTDAALHLGTYQQYITVVPLQSVFKRLSEVESSDSVYTCAKQLIEEAVQAQMLASNERIKELEVVLASATAPVQCEASSFRPEIMVDASEFYGPYRL